MRDKFDITRFLGIFVRTDNLNYEAGGVYLFAQGGPRVYDYHREAGTTEWALKRVWFFFLFAIIHVGEGKSTSLPGWHITFTKLSFKKEYQGFSVRWAWADRYGSMTQTLKQRINRRLGRGHGERRI